MLKALLFCMALGGASAAGFAAAAPGDKPPEVLKHVGAWHVDWGEDACNLLGVFGEGDKAITVRFTRYQPGSKFDLSLYGKRAYSGDPRLPAKVDFGQGFRKQEAIAGSSGKVSMLFFSSMRLDGWEWKEGAGEAPDITSEQEAAVTGATFLIGAKRPFRLEFGSMGKPMAAMRTCLANLVKHWGFDPEVQANLVRSPRPLSSPQSWLDSSDYPLVSVMNGHNGMVQFRLDVEAGGDVSGCRVLSETKPDDFGEVTCKSIRRRAKFEPALDAAGKPVRSFYVNKVLWKAG